MIDTIKKKKKQETREIKSCPFYLFKKAHVCTRTKSIQPCLPVCNTMDHSIRFFYPWDSPVKNTGVGCYALLQGIFWAQGSNPIFRIAGRFFTFWTTKEDPPTPSQNTHKNKSIHAHKLQSSWVNQDFDLHYDETILIDLPASSKLQPVLHSAMRIFLILSVCSAQSFNRVRSLQPHGL